MECISSSISIVIGFVDEDQELFKSLESIHNQSSEFHKNIQVIIMSKGVCSVPLRNYKPQYSIIEIVPPQKGIYNGLNYISSLLSENSLIWFLGAGDCILEGGKVITAVISDKEFSMHAFTILLLDQNYSKIKYVKPQYSPLYGKICNTLPHQGLIIRNKLLKQYPYMAKCNVYADFQFSLFLSIDKNICALHHEIVSSSFRMGGISTKASFACRLSESTLIRRKLLRKRSYIVFTFLHAILLLSLFIYNTIKYIIKKLAL